MEGKLQCTQGRACCYRYLNYFPLPTGYPRWFFMTLKLRFKIFRKRPHRICSDFAIIDLFTDTAAILNLLDLRSIMGCPGGMSSIRYTRSVYTRAFRANFWLSSPRKKIVMGKKDRCAVIGCNNDRLFPEKYTVKFSFCPKNACK